MVDSWRTNQFGYRKEKESDTTRVALDQIEITDISVGMSDEPRKCVMLRLCTSVAGMRMYCGMTSPEAVDEIINAMRAAQQMQWPDHVPDATLPAPTFMTEEVAATNTHKAPAGVDQNKLIHELLSSAAGIEAMMVALKAACATACKRMSPVELEMCSEGKAPQKYIQMAAAMLRSTGIPLNDAEDNAIKGGLKLTAIEIMGKK